MKSNSRLGWFITFIMLSAPQKRAVTVCKFTYIQPAVPEFLPLTRFLRTTLDRLRARELLLAREPAESQLVFRIGMTGH